MKPLQTYYPFGPPIGYAELPKELMNDLNKGCDDIVKNEELSKAPPGCPQELLISADIINKWVNGLVLKLGYMYLDTLINFIFQNKILCQLPKNKH